MKKTINWVLNHLNKNEGICISDKNKMSYPEVSGYLIPTLLNLGYNDEAKIIAGWLVSIQNENGSWSICGDKYTFDTAMILGGLQSFGDLYKVSKDKACKFLLSQIEESGRISTKYHMKDEVPEKILIWVATILAKEGYNTEKIWDYYCTQKNFWTFNCLLHFYCYVLDACLESKWGQLDLKFKQSGIKNVIENLAKLQKEDGSISAYKDANWVCYTGVAQAAILFYKVGLKVNGDRAMQYLKTVISEDGGFLGGNGASMPKKLNNIEYYFDTSEISWAAKFYLDAYQLMIKNK